MSKWLSSHQQELTFSLGKTCRQPSRGPEQKLGKTSGVMLTYRVNSEQSRVRRKSLTHGWIKFQSFRERLSEPSRCLREGLPNHCALRERKLFEHGYYTLLKSALVLDQPGFQHVWIDGLGMDPWGRKMSKSSSNGIDADSVLSVEQVDEQGLGKSKDRTVQSNRANKISESSSVESMRRPGWDDFHINPEEIEKNTGVLTKLFNVARFASQFDIPDDLDRCPETLAPEDKWVLAGSKAPCTTNHAWANFDIYTATQALKTFGTGLLPSLPRNGRSRLYDGDESAAWTLHRMVRDFMAALSPVCPFFTPYFQHVYGSSSVDVDTFPSAPLPRWLTERMKEHACVPSPTNCRSSTEKHGLPRRKQVFH